MELIRVKAISKKYSISPSTIYRWHCYGKFPQLFARIGKLLFVDEAELRRIAEKSKEANVEIRE